ncbi:feruloyl esterase B [Xylariaceae sp. FL0016]|nr:feruloyl esterase B [Xylariaceae sp. FL0016]
MKPSMGLPLLAWVAGTLAASSPHFQRQATECASLTAPEVSGASVVSITAAERRGVQMAFSTTSLDICDVNVTLTHGTANDKVRIEVWMPLEGWNGRFQGTGGGGFIAGTFGIAMAPAVADGYAAASTDAGLATTFDGKSNSPNGSSNAASGTALGTNTQLLTNFASLSYHEMAIVGKALTKSFYGNAPSFSYWNGCSTGGRQGMSEAQAFPDDFDGILAMAPAINWNQFVTAELWPYAVMNSAQEFPSACVFNALQQATITSCDANDGARDQLIADPAACDFDSQTIVGQSVTCDGATEKITSAQAAVYSQILQGPIAANGTQLWFGLEPGTSPTTLATTEPFSLPATWIQDIVDKGSGNVNISAVNVDTFPDVLQLSETTFADIIATNNPDLSAFKAAGGKLLTWHGLADQLIFPQGTFDYVERVQAAMGGREAVDEFYRVFAAPGVQHCAGGTGPEPSGALDALVSWVENGTAPDTLAASKTTMNATVTRNLCRFPMVLQYKGSGDINAADSWACVNSSATQADQALVTALAPKIAVSQTAIVLLSLVLGLWAYK